MCLAILFNTRLSRDNVDFFSLGELPCWAGVIPDNLQTCWSNIPDQLRQAADDSSFHK
jgi:hypothetical protein